MTILPKDLPAVEGLLQSGSLRAIFESQDLAQLGDFLVNFIYSTVRIAIKGSTGSIHVWDSSLRDAMEQANLRDKLGKRTKTGRVADAAEALVAFVYFRQIITLDEMIIYLSRRLTPDDFAYSQIEKAACANAFGELLARLIYLVDREDLLDING